MEFKDPGQETNRASSAARFRRRIWNLHWCRTYLAITFRLPYAEAKVKLYALTSHITGRKWKLRWAFFGHKKVKLACGRVPDGAYIVVSALHLQ